jgi:hypothetical protein
VRDCAGEALTSAGNVTIIVQCESYLQGRQLELFQLCA